MSFIVRLDRVAIFRTSPEGSGGSTPADQTTRKQTLGCLGDTENQT